MSDGYDDERVRLRRLVWPGPPGVEPLGDVLERLCAVAVAEVRLLGAALTVLPTDSSHPVAAASSETARALEDLQFSTGDGPSGEASRSSTAVLASGLDGATLARWPGFHAAAAGLGVEAVFSFPLHVGAARLGALSLYRSEAGRLTRSELLRAFVLADLAVEVLVDGSLPGQDGSVGTAMNQALDGHAHVYQAQGMVMVALGVPLSEALARMRAHAYAHDLTLATLSTAIVEGHTRLTKE